MNKENKMNKKMIAVVMLVVIGTLVVSAFSWVYDLNSNHQGLAISERANCAGDQVAVTEDAMANHWDAMAKFYAGDQVASAEDVMANHWDAMAKFYAGDQVAVTEDAMANHWDAMAKFYMCN
jgi:hypothetical protein